MELLAIKSDLAFRAVFGRECEKCKKALTAPLNDVLDLDITEISYANPLNLQSYDDDKKSEMDIEVVTNKGERIDIEIQLLSMPGFKDRMVYYGSKLINESLNSGEGYEYLEMKKCKVLSIIDFTLFDHNKKVQNRFRFQEMEDHFELTDVLEIVFFEMSKLEATKSMKDMGNVERWLYFLKYVNVESKQEQIQEILQESEGITMAMEILKEVSADEQLRTRIRLQEKAENDQKARIYYARLEGKEEGRQEGRQEGKLEEKLGIAKNLLDVLDDQTIALKTGLSIGQVATLRAKQ